MKKPHKAKPKAGRRKARPAVASRRPAPATPRGGRTFPGRLAARGIAARRLAVPDLKDALSVPFARLVALANRTRDLPRSAATGFARIRTGARSASLAYSPDEREVLMLVFLPILLMASAIVLHQSVRSLERYIHAVSFETEIAAVHPAPERAPVPIANEIEAKTRASEPAVLAPAALPRLSGAERMATTGEPLVPASPASPLASLVPSALPSSAGPSALAPRTPPPSAIPLTGMPDRVAALAPLDDHTTPPSVGAPEPIATFEVGADGKPVPRLCVAEAKPEAAPVPAPSELQSLTPEAFGLRLAKAAEAQVGAFVVYDDAYRSISYPMGDVNPFFGVCTDVVVRAYRALGFDLQRLVHDSRAGTGDTSIDHRRTEVLRRFFARQGDSLPITTFAEDYRPGDIVTYYRPQNRHTRSHIAIVSDVVAPSGRLMIVHNRGWGPALEDALFVDEITGHYRYRGPKPEPAAPLSRQAALSTAPTFSASLVPFAPAPPAN